MLRPLRLEAQDTALSRRQHRFEAGRGRHNINELLDQAETGVLFMCCITCVVCADLRARGNPLYALEVVR